MSGARSASQILKRIGCAHLSLYRGEGYWYFDYFDGDETYGTRSVMVMYLNSMSVEAWVSEGLALVAEMEGGAA